MRYVKLSWFELVSLNSRTLEFVFMFCRVGSVMR